MSNTEPQPLAIAGKNGNGTIHLLPGAETEFWKVEKTGMITLRGNMPEKAWLELAEFAIGDFEFTRDSHLAAMFRVGDVLSFGEREYGETYAQAIDSTRRSIRLSVKTLENVAWICGSVKPPTRHLALSLSHHEVVAKITDDAEQKRFLDLAEENEWSVSDLRKAVKEKYPPRKREGGGTKVIVNLETDEGIIHALEKGLEFLLAQAEEEGNTPDDWSKERGAAWFPTVGRLFDFFAQAEEPAREGAKAISAYLDNPDSGPLKSWSDARKNRWSKQLDAISRAARRMGVTACGNPAKGTSEDHQTPPPAKLRPGLGGGGGDRAFPGVEQHRKD